MGNLHTELVKLSLYENKIRSRVTDFYCLYVKYYENAQQEFLDITLVDCLIKYFTSYLHLLGEFTRRTG